MNKIEKLRKIINESYCQECDKFGFCEYCEPKQTLADIENVLSVYEYLLISNRNNADYEKKVEKATEAYKRLMDIEEIKVRTADQISEDNLLKYKELKIWSIIKKYPGELGMILQCKDYEEYKSTFSDIDCEEEIEITEEQFNLIKNFFAKKEPITATPNLIIDNVSIDNCEVKGLLDKIKCPYCNECYYREEYVTSTLINSPTIIKDGKVISNNLNTVSIHCRCLNCGKDFNIITKDGKTMVEE